MKIIKALSCLLVLLLLVPGSARAQVFTVPANPFPQAPKREKRARWQAGAYLALWDFAPIQAPGADSERVNADLSPVLSVDYFITRSLSLGGWWNPFRGEIDARDPTTSATLKVADFDASFWDLRATYYFLQRRRYGWSFQVGFSQLHYDVELIPALRAVGQSNFAVTSSSPNLWISRTQQIGSRSFQGRSFPMRLFGSAGYYTSSQFDRALNLIVGGSVPLSPRLSVSSSAWFNNLDDLNTRVTVGLDGTF